MKILNGIHVVEPANWRKAERVRNLPGLREQLDVEAGDGLAQAIRCGPERGKAAALPGMQFVLEFGKSGSLQNSGEGLDKAVNRWDGDGVAGYARVMEQVRDKRGREQREIDGQKDGEASGSAGHGGADSRQRAQARLGIFDNRRVRGERCASGRSGSCDCDWKSGFAQD